MQRKILNIVIFSSILLFIFNLQQMISSKKNPEQEDTNKNVLSGIINDDFYNRLIRYPKHSNITISSKGGWPNAAIKSARYIDKNEISITIVNECMSACAEYLLVSTNTLKFENYPIIGFHGNPKMEEEITKKLFGKEARFCNFRSSREFSELYRLKESNIDFWKEQEKRLLLTPRYQYLQNCPDLKMSFQHKFWMPTSSQLRELLGISFTGTLCSDRMSCIVKRLDKKWSKNTTFVVGDEIRKSKRWY